MSYTQRNTTDKSPFAMTYHTSTWNISTSPNTATQTWLTSSGNGFTFTGSGYVFGFLVAEPYQNLAAVKLGDTNNPRFTWGEFIETTNHSGTRSQVMICAYTMVIIQSITKVLFITLIGILIVIRQDLM